MIRSSRLLLTLSLSLSCICLPLVCLSGCGGADSGTPGTPAKPASAEAQKLVLAVDPGEAKTVVRAKVDGPAANAVLKGRIGAIAKGYAAFTLMDLELPYCGEKNTDDDCKTPWDYCCESAKTITANSLAVEARDAAGEPIKTDALPGLRLLDAVKVTGKLVQDENGNFVLLATGIFRTERPKLAEDLRWPE